VNIIILSIAGFVGLIVLTIEIVKMIFSVISAKKKEDDIKNNLGN
jgi:hypothetical protein